MRRGSKEEGESAVGVPNPGNSDLSFGRKRSSLSFPFSLFSPTPPAPGQSKGFFAASRWGISYLALRWSSQTYISPINTFSFIPKQAYALR